MKKFAFLLIFFILLAAAAWGADYEWTGDGGDDDWNNATNWKDENNDPASNYPGELDTNDTVIIDGIFTVEITAALGFPLTSLEITGGASEITGTLTATKLTLNDELTLIGTMEITDLDVGINGKLTITNTDTVLFGDGKITTLSTTQLTIEDVNGTIGDINVGARTISIETDNTNSSPITLGTLTGGAISLTLDGTRNFDSGGNTFDDVTVSGTGVITLGSDLEAVNLTNSGTLNAGSIILLNNGEWKNSGIFNHNNHKVVFEDTDVYDNNTFYNVECIGTVKFENDKKQTIENEMDAVNALLLTVLDPLLLTYWELDIDPDKIITNASTQISWCNSAEELDLANGTDADDQGNNHNVFKYKYIWKGTASNVWGNANNWQHGNSAPAFAPTSTSDEIHIPTAGLPTGYDNPPNIISDLSYKSLEIDSGAVLDLKEHTLTLSGTLTNNGIIALYGMADQVKVNTNNAPVSTTGTIHYYDDATPTTGAGHWVFGGNYNNLIIENTVTMVPANNLNVTVAGNAEIESAISIGSLAVTGTSAISANITTTGDQTYTGAVTLGGAGTDIELKATNTNAVVTLGVISGTKNLIITGNAKFNDAVNVDSLAVSGTSTIADTVVITTTAAGAAASQVYGAVNLSGVVVLDATAAANDIIFNGFLSGGTSLTITNGNVTFAGTSSPIGDLIINNGTTSITTFTSALFTAKSIEVSGTSLISASITTNDTAGQTYTGAVTLGADVTLNVGSANPVVFIAPLDGDGKKLTITGDVEFNGTTTAIGVLHITGDAEFTSTAFEASSIEISGLSTMTDADITTAAGQIYSTAAFVGDVELTAGSANTIVFNGLVGGGDSLTITDGSVSFAGTSSPIGALIVNGAASISTFASDPFEAAFIEVNGTSAISADITTTDPAGQTYKGIVNITNVTNVVPVRAPVLTATGGSFTTVGNVSAPDGLTVAADADVIIGIGGINSSLAITGLIHLGTSGAAGTIMEINGNIYAQRLYIDAPNTNVKISIGVIIDVAGPGNHTNSSGLGASIYADVNELEIEDGAGEITPGPGGDYLTAGQFCIDAFNFIHVNRIVNNRYHFHQKIPAGMNLVFAPSSKQPTIENGIDFSSGFYLVDSDTTMGESYTVTENSDIYIYNIEATEINNILKVLEFKTSGTGKIYFWHNFVYDGDLTLMTNLTDGGIQLYSANIHLTNDSFTTNSVTTYLDDSAAGSKITADNIELNHIKINPLLPSASQDLTLDANNITLNGTSDINGSLSITADNNAALDGTFNISAGLAIKAENETTLDGTFNISAGLNITADDTTLNGTYDIGAGLLITAVNDITLNDTYNIAGNATLTADNITLNCDAKLTGTGNMTIENSGLFTLEVEKEIELSGSFKQISGSTNSSTNLSGWITTGTGSISFEDVVTVSKGEIESITPAPASPEENISPKTYVKLETAGGDIIFGKEIISEVNKKGGVLILDAGTTGTIDIEHPIGYKVDTDEHAYLEYFEVKSGGSYNDGTNDVYYLYFHKNVYAVNMIFRKDFKTISTSLDPDEYIMFSVPKETGGSIRVYKKHGGTLTISGGTYHPEHTHYALNFFQKKDPDCKFEDVKIAKSSYIRVNNFSIVAGKKLTLAPGDPPPAPGASPAHTTLDLTAMDLKSWDSNQLVLQGKAIDESSRVIIGNDTGWFLQEFNYKTEDPRDTSKTGWAYIQSTKGDVTIEPAGANKDEVIENIKNPMLILEMHIDDDLPVRKLSANVPLGSLRIFCETKLEKPLGINGELIIRHRGDAKGKLNAGTNTITMRAGLEGERNISDFTHAKDNKIKYARFELIRETDPPADTPNDPSTDMDDYPFSSSGKVVFDGDPNSFFEIVGSTIWKDFECTVPGAVIQFSMHPYHHVFLGEFKVQGGTGLNEQITLTRYLEDTSGRYKFKPGTLPPGVSGSNTDLSLPSYPASKDLKNDTERNKFWNFNYYGTQLINYTDIYFSHAWNQRIPINREGLKIIPYFSFGQGGDPDEGQFNYNWGIDYHTVIYSFVEDANGNGKADRIRVQSNVVLNKDYNGASQFSQFTVKVDGYKVLGYELVSEKLDSSNVNDEMEFYIYLEEQPSIYDGKPLSWRIIDNYTLRDNVTGDVKIGDYKGSFKLPDDLPYKTINTIPPRISHAFTLPEHNQTYFCFSQPVKIGIEGKIKENGSPTLHRLIDRSEASDEIFKYFGNETQTITFRGESGDLSYVFDIKQAPSAEELAALPPIGDSSASVYFTAEDFKGISFRALDWNDEKFDPELYIYYPSPRYPKDWNYSAYETYIGNTGIKNEKGEDLTQDDNPDLQKTIFVPPYKVISPGMIKRLVNKGSVTPGDFDNQTENDLKRRSTDILVSINQKSADDNRYFALPRHAMHALQPGSDGKTEDNTTIFAFDGSKYLEARGKIEMHAQMNPSFTGDLELFWTNKIDTDFRLRGEEPARGKNTGGLWQPDLTALGEDDSLYIFAPRQIVIYPQNGIPGNLNYFSYILSGNLESGQKLEFIFRVKDDKLANPVNSDMFIATLDIPKGAEIPGDWYKRIRPFSFDIQDLRLQRGGVTIMNNVINSDKKEKTYLRYHLVRPGRVTIQVYTLDGSLVKSIRRNEQRTAGEWVDTWDGTNAGGRAVARGMYFIRVVAPDIDEIRKVMVVK